MSIEIRAARPADAATVAEIYNQGIEERQATFETQLRDAADFADAELLVAVEGERVVGWAKLGEYSPRECYSGVSEASIYVERSARGSGVGRALFEALAEDAERSGHWKLIGLLFPENEASVALCRRAGFREVGVFRRHGRLDGEWRDVLLVERLVGEAAEPESG
jgi:L-amino acid N-acyltransferase YncA